MQGIFNKKEVPFASLAYDFVLERHLAIIYSKYNRLKKIGEMVRKEI